MRDIYLIESLTQYPRGGEYHDHKSHTQRLHKTAKFAILFDEIVPIQKTACIGCGPESVAAYISQQLWDTWYIKYKTFKKLYF